MLDRFVVCMVFSFQYLLFFKLGFGFINGNFCVILKGKLKLICSTIAQISRKQIVKYRKDET